MLATACLNSKLNFLALLCIVHIVGAIYSHMHTEYGVATVVSCSVLWYSDYFQVSFPMYA